MATDTRQGRADHRAVELYERLCRRAREIGVSPERCERIITASVMEAMGRDWWTRKGYTMPPREVPDAD
jgi:hypothetical protein